MKNVLYIVDELLGRLGDNLLIKLGPRLGFRCEFYFPQEDPDRIYPGSGSYVSYRNQPDEVGWMFITGLITYDRARTGTTRNDPVVTEGEKRGFYHKQLPLSTKVRVHIPGGRVADLKVVNIMQDPSRTRSFFLYTLEPIL